MSTEPRFLLAPVGLRFSASSPSPSVLACRNGDSYPCSYRVQSARCRCLAVVDCSQASDLPGCDFDCCDLSTRGLPNCVVSAREPEVEDLLVQSGDSVGWSPVARRDRKSYRPFALVRAVGVPVRHAALPR